MDAGGGCFVACFAVSLSSRKTNWSSLLRIVATASCPFTFRSSDWYVLGDSDDLPVLQYVGVERNVWGNACCYLAGLGHWR